MNTTRIFEEITEKGFAVIASNETQESKILGYHTQIISSLGVPSEHNFGKKDYVWKISPKHNNSKTATFSEHNKVAELHTDSAYRLQPENYFSLSVVRKAECGGGETHLLDMKSILQGFDDADSLNVLRQDYSIAIPDIFQKSRESFFINAPIVFGNHKIRFRNDLIEKGFYSNEATKDSSKVKAFQVLRQSIETSDHIKQISLGVGDVIIIDNHRVLHGRTAFQDNDRLLYRIRFNGLDANKKV